MKKLHLYRSSRSLMPYRGSCAFEASFTVEASLIMMILIPLLVTSLLMSEYLCDRTRAQAVLAEEAVMRASGEEVSVSGPAGFFFLDVEKRSRSSAGGCVTESLVSADRIGVMRVQTELEAALTKRKPVRLIRKLERIKALAGS